MPNRRFPRPRALVIVALCTLAAASAAPGRALAQGTPWPFLPHANNYRFVPTQPQDDGPVWLELSSPLPYPCGDVVDAQVVDSAHVTLTLRPRSACTDSMLWRTWSQAFGLGRFAAGMREVAVHLRVEWPSGPPTDEHGVIPFEVVHVDPPPPPDPDSGLASVFLWTTLEPATPMIGDDVQLTVLGRFPYACGEIAESHVDANHDVFLRLRRRESCSDTTRRWQRTFDLGELPRGANLVWVRATIEGSPDRTTDSMAVSVVVSDPDEPPGPSSGIAMAALPAAPTDQDAVTVTAIGRFPFDCGQLADARVIDAHHLALTLKAGPACGDTARSWERSFAIGVLPAGTHTIELDVATEGGDTLSHRLARLELVVSASGDSLPAVLGASTPNPFREESRFAVTLEHASPAEVSVFDVNGRRVAVVFQGVLPAGSNAMRWNGRRTDGAWAASGVYFYRLALPDRVLSRRVVLLARP